MKVLFNVTGSDILDSYLLLNNDPMGQNEYKHFSRAFDNWINDVRDTAARRQPSNVSVNPKTFLGKKTRAMLHAINKPVPKTLGLLIAFLWDEIPEREYNSPYVLDAD